MIRVPLVAGLLVLGLSGCDDASVPSAVRNDAAANTAAPVAAPTPTKLSALPEAFRGRWGSTPADCKGGAGFVKVDATTMAFSGVTAKVRDIVAVRPDRVTATVDYTNRKGKWQSPTTMTLQDDGKTLAREDTHPSGMFSYQRCAG